MASKSKRLIRALRLWLCLKLGCAELVERMPTPITIVDDGVETFRISGYDIEITTYDGRVHVGAFLKGEMVLSGWGTTLGPDVWSYGARQTPDYKTRKYLRDQMQIRLTQLKAEK